MKTSAQILTATILLISGFLVVRNLNSYSTREQSIPVLAAASAPLDRGFVKCQIKRTFDFSEVNQAEPIAPLFDNLGDHHFEVTTSHPQAQQYFDQGLKLLYAFNHAEAHRSFREAVRLDPDCVMAYWGQAMALGPNINDPFPDRERTTRAFKLYQIPRKRP
jgi:hypothetical protein